MGPIETRRKKRLKTARNVMLALALLFTIIFTGSYVWCVSYDGARRGQYIVSGLLGYWYFDGTDAEVAAYRAAQLRSYSRPGLTVQRNTEGRKLNWEFKFESGFRTATPTASVFKWPFTSTASAPTVKVNAHYVQLPIIHVLITCWLVAILLLLRARDRTMQGRCSFCKYNLTGNLSGICPECGTSIANPLKDSVPN